MDLGQKHELSFNYVPTVPEDTKLALSRLSDGRSLMYHNYTWKTLNLEHASAKWLVFWEKSSGVGESVAAERATKGVARLEPPVQATRVK